MDLQFNKLKNAISQRQSKMSMESVFLGPELGFRILYNRKLNEIKVNIIAARHLPVLFGLSRVDGYIIKIKMFPGKEKYETKYKKESWPTYNEEFTFKLNPNEFDEKQEKLNGKFIVLTGYAVLEQNSNTQNNLTPICSPNKKDKLFKMFNGESLKKMFDLQTNAPPSKVTFKEINNMTFEKRRTIGSITHVIDVKQFTRERSNNWISTDDVWKTFQDISNGITAPISKKNENRKGEAEIGLLYTKSEDGETCIYELSISRMHCNMQTMQKQEEFNGLLYIKLRILNDSEVVNKGKTEKFAPSISHKFDITSARLKSKFHITEIENISFQVLLLVKTKAGEKDILGSIYLASKSNGPYLNQWEKCIETPGNRILKWQYFQ